MSTKHESQSLTTVYVWGDCDEDVITDHTASQDCVAAPDLTTSQDDTVTRPTEKSTSATDVLSSPADKWSSPADELSSPADEMTNRADKMTNSDDKLINPADELTYPADKLTYPADELTCPAAESTCPADESTCSADQSTCPADESTSRSDKPTSPPDKLTSPPDKLTSSSDKLTSPPDKLTSPHYKLISPHYKLTSPPCKLTSPPYKLTSPPYKLTSPPHKLTSPPYKLTFSPYKPTRPPYKLTRPPYKLTRPPYKLTSPPYKLTSPPYKLTSPPYKLTSPPYKLTSPPYKLTSPPYKSTGPITKSSSLVEKTSGTIGEQASPTETTSNKVRNFFSPVKRTASPINKTTNPFERNANTAKKRGSFSKTIANITEKLASFTDKATISGTENTDNVLAHNSLNVADSSGLSVGSANHSTENTPTTEHANNTLEDSISSSGNSESPYDDTSLDRKSQRNASSRSKSFPSCQKEDICSDKKKEFKPFENFKWARSTPNITGDGVPAVTDNTSLSCADLSSNAKPSVILRRRSSSFRRTNSIRADLTEIIDKPLLREHGILPDDICKVVSKDHTVNQVKRQGEIYEIIQTERVHCIAIANFVQMCYSKTGQILLKEEPDLPAHMEFIFEYHYAFLEKLRNVQQDGVYIERVGDVFGEHLGESSVDLVIRAYSIISHCCKFAMNAMPPPTQSCLQSVPLRLTKYQTQLEALNKHSKDEDFLEQTQIFQALTRVKEVLTTINANVDAMEKKQRLSVLQHKLDSKSYLILRGIKFWKQDLDKNRCLIHEENVKVRFSSGKVTPAIILILDDLLIFLQETMSGKYQFLAPERVRKVDPLDAYIIREKAGTGDTLFIISSKKKGNITEVTCASARLRNTLVYVLRKTIKAYTEKRQKHFQDEREISVNYAEESFEAFEISAKECLAENRNLTSDYTDRQDLFKRGLKSKHLLTASLKSTINVMKSFSKELACACTQQDSVPENIQSAFPKIIGYLDLAIKLNEVSTGHCSSMSKLELNYSISDKMEELRLQQEIVENEKRKTEQLFVEERESLAIKKAEFELIRLRQEAKEEELKEREQRLLNRAATMDMFLGALFVKNNKIFVPAETSPSDMMNTLVEHYLKTRDNLDCANENLERFASRRRLPTKSMPNIIPKIVQESAENVPDVFVDHDSTSKKNRSQALVSFHEANKPHDSSRSPQVSCSSVPRSHEAEKSDDTTAKGDKKKSARNRLSGIIYRTIGRSKKTFTPTDASIKASEMLLKGVGRSNCITKMAPINGSKTFVPENPRSTNMERESRGMQVRQTIPHRLANCCPPS